jgi:hypothetical protein
VPRCDLGQHWEKRDGHQMKRLTAVRKGIGRLFHWDRPHRPDVRTAGTGPCSRRERHG